MVAIIDFDDSFTYNIACELNALGHHSRIINYQDIEFNFLYLKNFTHIIWGPGPGHPNDYVGAQNILKSLMQEPIQHLGVCLGHQMIWTVLGYKIERLKKPFHGISKKIILDSFWSLAFKKSYIHAQFYNSWHLPIIPRHNSAHHLVAHFNGENSIVASWGNNFISYQFHPESIGTENSSLFFEVFFNKNLILKG